MAMDFDLTDEQQLIRETARQFADRELAERARENDRNHHFDTELVGKIADQGYLGAIVPQEYGGAGLDYVTYAIVVEEIGRHDSAMRTVISVQTSLVCSSILRWGTEEQKQRYLPKLCTRRVARLLRPHRARHRLRRRQPEDARAQDRQRLGAERQQDVDLARHPRRRRDDLRPDGPREAAPRAACFLVETDTPGFSAAGDPRQDGPARHGHRLDRARRRRGGGRRAAGRGRRGLQGGHERARLRPLLGRRRLRRRLPGLARPLGRATRRSASSSAGRSPRSSSCRR